MIPRQLLSSSVKPWPPPCDVKLIEWRWGLALQHGPGPFLLDLKRLRVNDNKSCVQTTQWPESLKLQRIICSRCRKLVSYGCRQRYKKATASVPETDSTRRRCISGTPQGSHHHHGLPVPGSNRARGFYPTLPRTSFILDLRLTAWVITVTPSKNIFVASAFTPRRILPCVSRRGYSARPYPCSASKLSTVFGSS
jgi:hypothetical protein